MELPCKNCITWPICCSKFKDFIDLTDLIDKCCLIDEYVNKMRVRRLGTTSTPMVDSYGVVTLEIEALKRRKS
jgi:hypothetical protein